MEKLDLTILHTSDRERHEIRKYIAKDKDSELCLSLFEILVQGKLTDTKAICKELYKDEVTNKYYRLRSRLEGYIREYKIRTVTNWETTGQAKMYARYFLAEQYARDKVYELAEDILQDLHDEAEALGAHHLLSLIYELRMSHADHLVDDVEDINKKAVDNAWLADNMLKIMMLFAMIRKTLKAARMKGTALLAEALIRTMLKPIPFTSRRLRTNIKFMHTLAGSWRSVIISRKGYSEFKPFLIKAYRSLIESNAFEGHPIHFHLDFMYFITHVYYRTHDFATSRTWLEKMKEMLTDRSLKKHPMQRKSISLEASLDFYEKKLDSAIQKLTDYLDTQDPEDQSSELMNMRLNHCVYLFFKKKYKEANKCLMKLPTFSKRLESTTLSQEWFFKRNLIDVVFQYELGNTEIARTRLVALPDKYKEFLDVDIYNRAERFIKVVLFFFDHPDKVRTQEFLDLVKEANLKQEGQSEDLQAILFFCWQRSKITGLDPYEEVFRRLEEEV